LGRGNVFDAMLFPEPPGVAKRLDPAFGADPGAGEYEHVGARRQIERRELRMVIDATHAGSLVRFFVNRRRRENSALGCVDGRG
jgi:hypothetical protein